MPSLEKALPQPKIELYSGKYFAACGLGGIIGMAPLVYPSIDHGLSSIPQLTVSSFQPVVQPIPPSLRSILWNVVVKSTPSSIPPTLTPGPKSTVPKVFAESSSDGLPHSSDTVSRAVENTVSMKCSNIYMARNYSHMQIKRQFSWVLVLVQSFWPTWHFAHLRLSRSGCKLLCRLLRTVWGRECQRLLKRRATEGEFALLLR